MERGYILDIGINNVLKMVGKGKAANFSDIKVTILNFKVSAERKLLKKTEEPSSRQHTLHSSCGL